MKMIMVQGTDDKKFELLCYDGDDCIWEQVFDTDIEAQAYGTRYLDGEFKGGFDVEDMAVA